MASLRLVDAFASAGCNRCHSVASFGANGLIAYGAGNAVFLYDPTSCRVVATLLGHTDRVNAVCWVRSPRGTNEEVAESTFVSCSTDKTVKLWRISRRGAAAFETDWACLATCKAHTATVTDVCALSYGGAESESPTTLIMSTGGDGKVNVFRHAPDGAVTHSQTLDYGTKYVQVVKAATMPGCVVDGRPAVVLALGGIDKFVHLYMTDEEGQFVRCVSLAGHKDWVRALDFTTDNNGKDLILASGSQDHKIRLWRISPVDTSENQTDFHVVGDSSSTTLSKRGHIFTRGKLSFKVVMETLLIGHSDWVSSVAWCPPVAGKDGEFSQPMCLLSSSMDRTMMIWRPDESDGVWVNEVTVGELGGNGLGFLGAAFGPQGNVIVAHSHQGSFHMWVADSFQSSADWTPTVAISGHVGPVQEIVWGHGGSYLVSASTDQSCRAFAEWKTAPKSDLPTTWYEIARPQTHGYDLNCCCFQGDGASCRFVSGADEKVIRVFDAPHSFVGTLANLTGEPITQRVLDAMGEERALGATIPTLGLSNKPIFDGQSDDIPATQGPLSGFEDGAICGADPRICDGPPLEEHLVQNTLWPESQKLYGHGNELVAICSNHQGTLLASGCKAQTQSHALVRIWCTKTWKEVGGIGGHGLTVTQLAFSPNDDHLLTVSRDRHFALFRVLPKDSGVEFEVVGRVKAHDRIIWDCSWSPTGAFFATASRDKTVKIWRASDLSLVSTLPFASPCTAVEWCHSSLSGDDLIAIGTESGEIQLWSGALDGDTFAWKSVFNVEDSHRHNESVRRLRWRPATSPTRKQLASCSLDHSVRVLTFDEV